MKKLKGLMLALAMAALAVLGAGCGLGQAYQGGECLHEKWSASDVKAATCTEDGNVSRTCLDCGFVDAEVVAAKGHTSEVIEGKAATCEEDGMTAGAKCGDCGEILVEQKTIEARGHETEVITGKAATCTEPGLTDGEKCSVCKTVLVAQEEIAVIAHTVEVVPGTSATCMQSGVSDGEVCTVCETVLMEQAILPALGHAVEVIPGTAATCTDSGLTSGEKCGNCGEIFTAQEVVAATGHTVETLAAVAATCTDSGLTSGEKCSVCDEILVAQEVVAALGHADADSDDVCDVCEKSLYPEAYTLADVSVGEQLVGSWYRFYYAEYAEDLGDCVGRSVTVTISNGTDDFIICAEMALNEVVLYSSVASYIPCDTSADDYFKVKEGTDSFGKYFDVYIPEGVTIETSDSDSTNGLTSYNHETHTLTSNYKITEVSNLQYVKRLVETDGQA